MQLCLARGAPLAMVCEHKVEISMVNDAKQFPELSADEQNAFLKIIGLLALLDSVQTDYAGRVADYLTDSSLNALMIILAQQEVIHNHSYCVTRFPISA